MSGQITIYIDADACPVREEVYKVAIRHTVPVCVVSNHFIRVLPHGLISRVQVGDGFDEADDYIAERAVARTIVITADILLADRCLKSGAHVLNHNGRTFDADNIASAIATRAIMADLRVGLGGKDGSGANIGGQKPFGPRDRSNFLQALHTVLEKMKRG